jgi:hypothetical protein
MAVVGLHFSVHVGYSSRKSESSYMFTSGLNVDELRFGPQKTKQSFNAFFPFYEEVNI